jgi:excisionase family DNA binding protein
MLNRPFPNPEDAATRPDRGTLLTVAEVAAMLRVSNMTVYRLIKSGELAAVRIGHGYRIRETEFERYLTDRSVRVEDV